MLPGIGSVLGTLSSAAVGPLSEGKAASVSSGPGFSGVLKSAVAEVDGLQQHADMQMSNFLAGAPDADMSKVVVSVEKADIAFQLMMQVRNKVVSAYQDIEKMQF